MFNSRKKRLQLLAAAILLVSLASLVISWLHIGELNKFNQAVKSDDMKMAATVNNLQGRFATAWNFHQAGQYDEALDVYREIETEGSENFRQAVRYNQADLYLRMASAAERKGEQDIATPLIELAKHKYRSLLRADSQNWQAKYNLETALKLLPDLDPAEFPDDVLPERSPEATGSVEIDRELP